VISFVPYEPGHLGHVEVQPAQAEWRARMVADYARALAVPGHAWTALDEGKRPIGCAGLLPQGAGRAHGWALLSAIPARHWPAMVRKIRAVLDAAPYRRIEATVRHDFGNGCRLAKLLGFEVEALMTAYRDGVDHFLYARVAR
jgi:hypothetical protein